MKKFISLVLCAVLLFGSILFIACGEKDNSGNDVTGEPKGETTAVPSEIMDAIVAKYPDIPGQKAM